MAKIEISFCKDTEVWMPSPLQPDLFASNYGRIKYKGKIVPQYTMWKGYLRIVLWIDQRNVNYSVHKVVASAFKVKGRGDQINHMNGDKHCNKPENLEYCTQNRNMVHSYKNGLHKGERVNKLNTKQVQEIRAMWSSSSFSQKEIAEKYGITRNNVSLIVTKRTWRTV